jgi:outer membrane protein TolC
MRATILFLALAVSFVCTAGAQNSLSATNARSLSLEDSIRMALEKNLDLQIARVNVRGVRAALLGAYGYYDPVFESQAMYSKSTEAGQFDPDTGLLTPPGDRENHTVSGGIVGALPWGMRYDIGADLNYFSRDFFTTVTAPDPSNPTNIITRIVRSRPGQYTLDTGASITQPLLRDFWTDAGRTQIKMNKADVRISEMALRLQVNTVVRDVMLAYYELIFAREDVVAKEKALERATRLAAENKRKVEVGTMAPLDEKQAESEAATARADLILALQVLGTRENELVRLITDNYEQWQGMRIVPTESLLAIPQAYNLPASWVSALTYRPDFNQLKAELERQGWEVKLAYNQLFPRLDLVGSYGRAGVDRRFSPTLDQVRQESLPRYSFGAVLSVPLGNRGARAAHTVAKSGRDSLELQVKRLHQDILFEVENAVGDAQGSFQQVTATREASEAAQAAYDAEVKKLENGKSTSFQVLTLQKDLTDARTREIRALADYNRALAELYFFEGTILDKRRITIER